MLLDGSERKIDRGGPRSGRNRGDKPLPVPFAVVVDAREKAPYTFLGLRADSRSRYRPLWVQVVTAYLPTGDYSIQGLEHLVAVERKSLEDLYSTLGQNRERFEREHERLAALDFGAVVIEAEWSRIRRRPPERSLLHPKTITRTALSWSIRYRVPWFTVEDRRAGELTTFRLLETYWRHRHRMREIEDVLEE